MCMPFHDVPTVCGDDTLAERHEQTMFLFGYHVTVNSECEFKIHEALEEEEDHLRTKDVLYGMRAEATLLHYRVKDG